ncbi:MAG: type IV secretion protein IcmB [Pseudomonadota bacterium]|nr:type IV secretion protein IcmB [Pseudomonadota bacterium]
MGLVTSLLDGIDVVLAWARLGLGTTVESNCLLQTADSDTVLVLNDGSLLSVIDFDGVMKLVGADEFSQICSAYQAAFSSVLSNQGHHAQIVFSYSKEKGAERIRKNYEPIQETMDKLGLSLKDLLKERQEKLPMYCADEKVYVVIRTTVDILTNEQKKQTFKDQKDAIAKSNLTIDRSNAQDVFAALPALRDAHDSTLKTLIDTCVSAGARLQLLSVHDAIKRIRQEVDWHFTDDSWKAVLPGDMVRPSIARSFSGNISDLLWPPLYVQLFPRDAFNVDFSTCIVGDDYYGMVYIELYPRHVQIFNQLLGRCLNAQIPWRMSFSIESGGMQALSIKKMFAEVLSFSSVQNRLIANGVDLLSYLDVNTDDDIVKLRTVCCTWASDKETLKTRVSLLARAVQGWGGCNVSQVSGDAFQGLVGTLPAVNPVNIAPMTVASLNDVISMMPLYRPSSPWQSGSLMLRSPDGKIWPYQPGSHLQSTSIDIIYARPGSGKSVLANSINLALCLTPGITRLPMISIIDIGPSSSGLISLIKDSLPPSEQYKASYHRISMTESYSINPLDTQLGARYPTPPERSFLVNFILLLVTPAGENKPYDGMSDMIGLVVDEAFKGLHDNANPNVYTLSTDHEIDDTLKDIGFVFDSKTSWWEVTDALFMAGFIKEAYRAQRYAVPLISDLVSVARVSNVEDLFGKVMTPTGEKLIVTFTRMVSSAVREYPVLSRPTKFDIGDARVVSLDLDEVAKTGGAAADKQTAVMYMLARYLLTRNFYLNIDSFEGIDQAYRNFHQKRIQDNKEDVKRLVMDEFHRTSHSDIVRHQVVQDMREGRKWGVQVALISQSLDDFDSVMIDFATSIFIMDAGPEQSIRKSVSTFGLPKSAEDALRSYVRGPNAQGATMLAIFATKDATLIQLVTLTLGPIELWAFSTTAEDYYLRDALYEKLGPAEARRLLAQLFPSGSASKYIMNEVTKQQLKEPDQAVDVVSVVQRLIDHILDQHNKDPNVKAI